ncbi:MAG: pyridoxal-phosphate dependent enzyme [bacterium]|nr:pyridoxal-phosphate dependent enzyme [bacterium]
MHFNQLHINTPLMQSVALSQYINGNVWLKIEAMQPSGSFKTRGIGLACREYISNGAERLVTSSGGNAGLAVAYAGRKYGVKTTVVVPETTTQKAIELIQAEQAEVIVEGASWDESHQYACNLYKGESAYIHPFDDPLVWKGHATMIDEIAELELTPDAVVLSVGGGGLLCGVLEGLHRHGWTDVPVIAVETEGADSLRQAVLADKLVSLAAIESIATTLGAKRVTQTALDWTKKHKVINHVVSDLKAVEACAKFVDHHRILVEPACGASLSAIYQPIESLQDKRDILVVVCGGVGVSMKQLQKWLQELS